MPDAPVEQSRWDHGWLHSKDMSQHCDIISPTPDRRTSRKTECRTKELLPFHVCALFSPVLEARLPFSPSQTVHGMAPCLSLSVSSGSRALLPDSTPRLSVSHAQPEPPLCAEVKDLSSSRAAHFTGKFVIPSAKARVCMQCRGAAIDSQLQQVFEIDVCRGSLWASSSAF